MNIYNLHSKPESLDHFEKVTETNPAIFWDKYKDNKEELKKRQKHIAKSLKYAYRYAKDILKAPFPAGEEAIAKDYAKDYAYAYYYARDVLKGPFPAGEEAIAKSAEYSYYYVRDVLKGPFPAGEEAISKDAGYAKLYAKRVLKKDF